jgi:hypothetical protein
MRTLGIGGMRELGGDEDEDEDEEEDEEDEC